VLTARGQMRNVAAVADDVAAVEAELTDPLGQQGPRLAGEGNPGTVPGDSTERASGGGQAGGGRGDTGGSTDRSDAGGGGERGPGA
jgi:hypothetical protein